MTHDEVLLRFKEVFCKLFDVDESQIDDETTASDIEGWDSLKHIVLISEIEKEFKVKLSMKDVVVANNVGDMVLFIQKELQ